MNSPSCRSSRPSRSRAAWCTSDSVTVPIEPPRQASAMRSPSSPGARPSRDSQAGPQPRSGVISSTPPMSKTTAWMVMVTMMPLAPRARASGGRAGWSELAEVAEQRVPDFGDLDRELQPDHGPVRPDRLPVHRDPAAGRLDDVGPDVAEHGHEGVLGAFAAARGGDVDPGGRLAVELPAAGRRSPSRSGLKAGSSARPS